MCPRSERVYRVQEANTNELRTRACGSSAMRTGAVLLEVGPVVTGRDEHIPGDYYSGEGSCRSHFPTGI